MNSVHKNDYSCIFRKNYLTLYSNTLKLSFKMQLSELLSNFDVLCVLMGYLDRSSIINLSRVSNAIGSLIQPESQRFGVHPGMNITHTEKFNKHIQSVTVNVNDNIVAFKIGKSIRIINLFTGKSFKHDIVLDSVSEYRDLRSITISALYLVYSEGTVIHLIDLESLEKHNTVIQNYNAIKLIGDRLVFSSINGELEFLKAPHLSNIKYFSVVPNNPQSYYFDSNEPVTILSSEAAIFIWDNYNSCLISTINRLQEPNNNIPIDRGTPVQVSQTIFATPSLCDKFIEIWDIDSRLLLNKIDFWAPPRFSLSYPYLMLEHAYASCVESSIFNVSQSPRLICQVTEDVHLFDDSQCFHQHSYLTRYSHVIFGKNVDEQCFFVEDENCSKMILSQLFSV